MRDRALGSTVRLMFNTTNPDGGGAPVAPSSAFAASDIRIYKDGSATEKTSTNGITVTSPFDSIVGLHLVEIDTSNSTGDAGFWASGSVYQVRLVTAKTVATYSVSGLPIGEFSIEVQTADVRKFGGTAGTFSSGKPTAELDSASRLAIWNTLTTESFAADSFGDLLIISDGTNGREVKVTGAKHIAADVHEVQPDGLSASTEITAVNTFATRVTTGLVADGPLWQFTANMLELGPSGSSVVTVLPATGIVADRSAGVTLTPVVGETISQAITLYRTDGTTAVNVSGKTLKIIFETMTGADVAVVENADIAVSGTNSNVVTFAYPSAVTASERSLRFALRDAAAPLTMYLQGICSVVAAPKVDA